MTTTHDNDQPQEATMTDKVDDALATLSDYAGSFITHWMDDDDPEDHALAVKACEEANAAEETLEAALASSRAMLAALKRIRDARNYCAEHGHHPQNMLDGAEFDDWAADIADTVIPAAEAAGITAAEG